MARASTGWDSDEARTLRPLQAAACTTSTSSTARTAAARGKIVAAILEAPVIDRIHIGKSGKFLTRVYQIEADCVRLLWVGKDRTKQSFESFFTLIGAQLAASVEFVCSDMWRPYLEVIAKNCPKALNILHRFHMVAKLNKALDEVGAGEARQMIRQGYPPITCDWMQFVSMVRLRTRHLKQKR